MALRKYFEDNEDSLGKTQYPFSGLMKVKKTSNRDLFIIIC